jgi:hypothetical protein
MEITSFGYIFIIICFLSFFFPLKYLFAIIIVSCVIQSTAIINFEEKGFPPYVIGSVFMVLRCLPTLSLISDIQKDKFVRYIVIFASFAVCASFMLPFWGEGIMINPIGPNTDKRPLLFGLGNIIQISYVILNFTALYCIYINRDKIPVNFTEKSFITSIILVLVIGFWEFIAKTIGLISFPYTFFYNNVGYAQLYMQNEGGLMRLNSTFLEASYCGAFLSASFWALISNETSKKYKLLCLFIGVALVLNLSGTGMIAFIAGIFIFIYLNKINKNILILLSLVFALAYIINLMGYFENMKNMLFNKAISTSGMVRSTALHFTWDIFLQTKGMGVGLGSHRGLDFISNTLVSLGIIGTVLFGGFYFYLLKCLHSKNLWLLSFALVLLVAQCMAIPDFSFPIMWMCFFMSAAKI